MVWAVPDDAVRPGHTGRGRERTAAAAAAAAVVVVGSNRDWNRVLGWDSIQGSEKTDLLGVEDMHCQPLADMMFRTATSRYYTQALSSGFGRQMAEGIVGGE